MYKYIEELTLNAWPALQTYLYDGWLLRIANGYTKRGNSISPIYQGSVTDLCEKVKRCEAFYMEAGMKPVFKMSPFVVSAELDQYLESRGYVIVEPSTVMAVDLTEVKEPENCEVKVEGQCSGSWLSLFAQLNNVSQENIETTRKMLGNAKLRQGFFTLYNNSVPVSCGLGVIEQSFVGLYDIVTDRQYRNQGFGEQLVLNILKWAKKNGASHSYLQVVQANAPAIRCYDKLGYKKIYTYWYRVKNL